MLHCTAVLRIMNRVVFLPNVVPRPKIFSSDQRTFFFWRLLSLQTFSSFFKLIYLLIVFHLPLFLKSKFVECRGYWCAVNSVSNPQLWITPALSDSASASSSLLWLNSSSRGHGFLVDGVDGVVAVLYSFSFCDKGWNVALWDAQSFKYFYITKLCSILFQNFVPGMFW